MARELHVRVHFEDGSLWATVDEYPGVFATADTLDELHASLTEGIALYLAEPGENPPRLELRDLRPASVETTASATLVQA